MIAALILLSALLEVFLVAINVAEGSYFFAAIWALCVFFDVRNFSHPEIRRAATNFWEWVFVFVGCWNAFLVYGMLGEGKPFVPNAICAALSAIWWVTSKLNRRAGAPE